MEAKIDFNNLKNEGLAAAQEKRGSKNVPRTRR